MGKKANVDPVVAQIEKRITNLKMRQAAIANEIRRLERILDAAQDRSPSVTAVLS